MNLSEAKRKKIEAIVAFHETVNEKLNTEETRVSLTACDFGHFFLITGRKTTLELMTDDLGNAKFNVSEPKLISFLRDDKGNITGDIHCIKVIDPFATIKEF